MSVHSKTSLLRIRVQGEESYLQIDTFLSELIVFLGHSTLANEKIWYPISFC